MGFSDGCDSDASPPGSDDEDDPGARTLQRRLREFDDLSDGSDDTTADSIDSPRLSPRSPRRAHPVASPQPNGIDFLGSAETTETPPLDQARMFKKQNHRRPHA